MSDAKYVHGTDPGEQARLVLLNDLTNEAFIEFLKVAPGTRVLEVGSGLGILAAKVAGSAPGVAVVGLERSPEQLTKAVRVEGLSHVHGDAHQLAFQDGTFDLVYCRYVLEHVADPVRVVSEMRRVARPGGAVAAMENDITLIRFDPPCLRFERVWAAFGRYQEQLRGDPLIGRRLFRLFRSAGFQHVELSIQPEVHWFGSRGFSEWIENLIGNVRSAQEGIVSSGLSSPSEVDEAIDELAALTRCHEASAQFVWNRVSAIR